MSVKLPFVLDKEDFDFEPRRQLAQRADIDSVQKEIIETVDVMEQRQDKLRDTAIVNRNLLLFVCLAVLPQLYFLIMRWITGGLPHLP